MTYHKASRRDRKRAAERYREKVAQGPVTADEIDAAHSHSMPPSFLARYDGTCARCFTTIRRGERVHYGPEGLVHHRHAKTEKVERVCDNCHMVKPCECDE